MRGNLTHCQFSWAATREIFGLARHANCALGTVQTAYPVASQCHNGRCSRCNHLVPLTESQRVIIILRSIDCHHRPIIASIQSDWPCCNWKFRTQRVAIETSALRHVWRRPCRNISTSFRMNQLVHRWTARTREAQRSGQVTWKRIRPADVSPYQEDHTITTHQVDRCHSLIKKSNENVKICNQLTFLKKIRIF